MLLILPPPGTGTGTATGTSTATDAGAANAHWRCAVAAKRLGPCRRPSALSLAGEACSASTGLTAASEDLLEDATRRIF